MDDQWDPHEGGDTEATPLTGDDGRYRVTQRYPGAGWYSAEVRRTSTTAAASSRTDTVGDAAR